MGCRVDAEDIARACEQSGGNPQSFLQGDVAVPGVGEFGDPLHFPVGQVEWIEPRGNESGVHEGEIRTVKDAFLKFRCGEGLAKVPEFVDLRE